MSNRPDFTTISVSQKVQERLNKKKGQLSIDNFLRKLLKMPIQLWKRGRPTAKPVKKKKK